MHNYCMLVQVNNHKTPPPAACRGPLEGLPAPKFFRALSDPRRVGLLIELAVAARPRNVGEMAPCCPTDFSVVSRHLSTLREAGILKSEKKGREVFYQVDYPALTGALRQMADAIEACCPQTKPRAKRAKRK